MPFMVTVKITGCRRVVMLERVMEGSGSRKIQRKEEWVSGAVFEICPGKPWNRCSKESRCTAECDV